MVEPKLPYCEMPCLSGLTPVQPYPLYFPFFRFYLPNFGYPHFDPGIRNPHMWGGNNDYWIAIYVVPGNLPPNAADQYPCLGFQSVILLFKIGQGSITIAYTALPISAWSTVQIGIGTGELSRSSMVRGRKISIFRFHYESELTGNTSPIA